jgi:hypothetical protein
MIKRMIKQGRHSASRGGLSTGFSALRNPPPDHLEWVKPAHPAGATLDGGRPERKGVAVQNSERALLPLPSEPAGLLWILASRRNASLQDLVVGTAVVYDWAYRPAAEASSKVGDDPSPRPAPSSTQG